jgi:adenylate cyclase
VASVENGREALAALRTERFDLLLLDLQMPELDGFAVLEARFADPALQSVPVIVTSSLEGAAPVARCIELGADDFLHKPVNPMLLKARVEASLERKQLRDRERSLLARLLPDLPVHLRQGGAAAEGRRVTATLLAARLGGIEPLAAAETPAATLDLLGSWSTLMVDAVEAHGGWVYQVAGDGVAAAFGTGAPADAALQALEAALEMRALGDQFNGERGAAGRPAPTLAIGLATGTVTVGHAGTQHRAALVCVGAAAQRAARLEALAGAAGETLIDEATHAALAGRADTEPRTDVDTPGPAHAGTLHAIRVRRSRPEP